LNKTVSQEDFDQLVIPRNMLLLSFPIGYNLKTVERMQAGICIKRKHTLPSDVSKLPPADENVKAEGRGDRNINGKKSV
jgi:hypothetical protein